ncbi:MAG: hypothetical protein KBD16_03905 [Candidatus Pacebacteria bacterium]|nr:hypothetical protein [Candidatus Paceibacterota bacterium]
MKREGILSYFAWSSTSWWWKLSLLLATVIKFSFKAMLSGLPSAVTDLTSTGYSVAGTARNKLLGYRRRPAGHVFLIVPFFGWIALGLLSGSIALFGGRLLFRMRDRLNANECDVCQSALAAAGMHDEALLMISIGMSRLTSRMLHTAGLLAIAKAEIFAKRKLHSAANEWAYRSYSFAQSAEWLGEAKQAIRIYRRSAAFIGRDAWARAEALAAKFGVRDQQLKMAG